MTTAKRRILFVDDDAAVLDGLRNVLRKQRGVWDLVFAVGGEAGIAELTAAPFDVVVSDMLMPGIDGAMLMRKAQELSPSAARIVLSGHSDRSAVVKALPVAHQFLNKPCSPTALIAAIERIIGLRALLADETLRRTVTGLERLPSVPSAYLELARLAAQPDVNLAQIAAVIEHDPAMTARVLQIVNSAYLGLSRHVASVQQALVFLGIDLMRALVLSANVFDSGILPATSGLSLAGLQRHSIETGRLARMFVRDPACSEEAFAAGILHDIGKIVLATCVPQRFAAVQKLARAAGRGLSHDAERRALGVTHAEVGAYLLGVWGVPYPIVEAVAHHHCPRRVSSGSCEVLAAVHVADALASADHDESPIDEDWLTQQGLIQSLEGWRAIAEAQRVA